MSNIILKVCILLSVYSYPSTGWSLAVVSNLFWSREYNSAKEICKYPSYSKVGGNYPLDLKIIWSSDVGKSCQAVGEEMGVGRTQIMNILKRKSEILDDFENNVSSSSSCYWKLYFCLLNIFIYLFVCFIQIISYWDNFINNKCKQE